MNIISRNTVLRNDRNGFMILLPYPVPGDCRDAKIEPIKNSLILRKGTEYNLIDQVHPAVNPMLKKEKMVLIVETHNSTVVNEYNAFVVTDKSLIKEAKKHERV